MKRRTFIQRGSIGLGALVVGAGSAGRIHRPDDEKPRIYGIPDSVKPRTQQELDVVRYSLSRTDLPPEIWEDVLAIGLLAQDVFDHPEVAQAFNRNPRGYLKRVGLDYVTLNPDAIEVKVALALGDPEIRAAVERKDPETFLRAIEERGLLKSPEPSQLAAKLSDQIEAMKSSLGPSPSPESCTLWAICLAAIWVWVLVIQDVAAAVTATVLVNVYAYALVSTGVIGHHKKSVDILRSNPSFRLATALGGQEFGSDVADAFLDENVEKIVSAVEGLRIYQDRPPMDPSQLRDLVRTQMLRQLKGHAVDIEPSRP